MGNLIYEGDRFVLKGTAGEQILLDCGDYLSNKSHVSMTRRDEENFLTIPELIAGLIGRETRNDRESALPLAVLDILLISQLIRTSKPLRVLEYGCLYGRLSWHLAEILGTFHKESVLVCAYDTIEPEWMRRITAARKLPKLSYLAGDFGQLHLQKKFFDIVVVNGMVNYLDPQAVLEDALQLAADDGVLLCYSNAAPLLESTFKLYFEVREEYELSPSTKILKAFVKDRCWSASQGE